MTEELEQLKKEVAAIRERNARVEANKAWETSWFRVVAILVLTYFVALLLLLTIGNEHPYRNALVPSLGFFLSVQSLPLLKRYWITHRLPKKDSAA